MEGRDEHLERLGENRGAARLRGDTRYLERLPANRCIREVRGGRRSRTRSSNSGLQLHSFDWDGDPGRFGGTLGGIARTAAEAEFGRVGVADHLWLHPITGGPKGSGPECYTTLGLLAAGTRRISLLAMVSGVHFRHPAFLAKAVTPWTCSPAGAPGPVPARATTRRRHGAGRPFPPQSQRYEMLEKRTARGPGSPSGGRAGSPGGSSRQWEASCPEWIGSRPSKFSAT